MAAVVRRYLPMRLPAAVCELCVLSVITIRSFWRRAGPGGHGQRPAGERDAAIRSLKAIPLSLMFGASGATIASGFVTAFKAGLHGLKQRDVTVEIVVDFAG